MKNIPKKIYLVIGDDVDEKDFNKLEHEFVTWCENRTAPNDIEYVKAKQDSKEVGNEILGLDHPWPLRAVLEQLIEASDSLLHRYNFDGHYHEEIRICVKRGREIVDKLAQRIERVATDHKMGV